MAMALPESGAKQADHYVAFLDVALANELASIFIIFLQPLLIFLGLSRCHTISREVSLHLSGTQSQEHLCCHVA